MPWTSACIVCIHFLAQEVQAGERANLLRDVRSTESTPVSALCCFCGCPSRILLDEGLLKVTGLVVHTPLDEDWLICIYYLPSDSLKLCVYCMRQLQTHIL